VAEEEEGALLLKEAVALAVAGDAAACHRASDL